MVPPWQIDGRKMETVADFILGGSKITTDGYCCQEIKRCLLLGRKAIRNLDSIIRRQGHYFANKGPSSQSYGFYSSYVWMWELDNEESWAPKNWCFQTEVLEKTFESPLDRKIKPVDPKGNQPWLFTGRADAETAILWPPDTKSWLIGKDPDAGKDWRQEEKEMTEDETVGWHHWLRTWVWASSGSWWTGKPGMLQSMGLQRVGHDWATELNWTEWLNSQMILSHSGLGSNQSSQNCYVPIWHPSSVKQRWGL